ncbi:MAG: hypothetical protein QNJ40_26300 [Xanthomonadales bacterium]|nr:hypothetical protein [Xanthomonadales bacterium]
MTYAPVYPHKPIEEIAPDLYMCRGSIKMNAFLRISRNMAIIRHQGDLTLVNPIRLSAGGESELKSLGAIKHVMRLGPFHGIDDPYYVGEFGARFWCQEGGESYREPQIDDALSPGGALPFPNAELFCFQGTRQPECALLLKYGSGILLTCDAIQHYGDYSMQNLAARLVMPYVGFPKTTLVGPIWLKLMSPEGGTLESEFRRLLELEFDTLLSAHGTLLKTGAREAVSAAVAHAFQNPS